MVDERQMSIADVEGAMSEGDDREDLTPPAGVPGLLPDAAEVDAVERRRSDPRNEIDIPVHPVADLFPMMRPEELNDLAEDIREHGLLNAIVLDPNGLLIDGRNRYVACVRAGREKRFATLNGHDPVAFILSQNVARRHHSSGQRAMALAQAREMASETPKKGEAASQIGVHRDTLRRAVTVLQFAPDLVDAVMSGAAQLKDAYDEARRRKEALLSDEARFERLRKTYPDLALMVQEEQLTLTGALAEADERKRLQQEAEERERQRISSLTRRFEALLTALEPPAAMDPDEWAADWLKADPRLIEDGADFSAERVLRAADSLIRYARLKREKENGR